MTLKKQEFDVEAVRTVLEEAKFALFCSDMTIKDRADQSIRLMLDSLTAPPVSSSPATGEVVDKEAYDNMVAWMQMNAPYRHMMTFKAVLTTLNSGSKNE